MFKVKYSIPTLFCVIEFIGGLLMLLLVVGSKLSNAERSGVCCLRVIDAPAMPCCGIDCIAPIPNPGIEFMPVELLTPRDGLFPIVLHPRCNKNSNYIV